MAKIKLIIIADILRIGGKELLIQQQIKHLDKQQFEIHLVTFKEGDGEVHLACTNLSDYYFCLNRKAKFDLRAIIRLRNYIAKHKIQLIHSHNWLTSLYVWFASLRMETTKIATFHGYDRSYRNMIHLAILKKFQAVICVSKTLRLDLYRMGLPWNNLLVIPNCYDPGKFYISTTEQPTRPKNVFRMIMVSSFRWQKDHITLIKTAALLKERGYRCEFNFIGGGQKESINNCRDLVSKLHLEKTVFFLDEKMIDAGFLSTFDLFTFSSFSETFGIAALEAMASGLPVLVSDIPATMELIKHGKYGFYFETGNEKKCAEIIEMIIRSTSLVEEIAEKARNRANDFHPKKIFKELEHIYLKFSKSST